MGSSSSVVFDMKEKIKDILENLCDGEDHDEYHVFGDDCSNEIDPDEAHKQLLAAFREYVEISMGDSAYPGFSPDEVSSQYTQGWYDAKNRTKQSLLSGLSEKE